MIKVVVFDFDGVIIDSNQLKYDAFFQIFPEDDDTQEAVKMVLGLYREKSRCFIIEKILEQIHKGEIFNETSHENAVLTYAGAYNSIVEKGAVACLEISGASESLKKLSKRYLLYLNSATPAEPLKRIVSSRSLSRYFKDVYGGPTTKIENLKNILAKENVSGGEVMVIGDGMSDLESARKLGCAFIGIQNCFNKFDDCSFDTLGDLRGLAALI